MSSRAIYEQLHRNPELSYQEFETTKMIATELAKYQLTITYLNPTGLIASTKTNFSQSLVFRADIDGLPISEQTSAEYQSQTNGVMHACGHDLHIAGLLEFISKINFSNITHNLIFVFQPGEEVDGGARIVLNNELFKSHQIAGVYAIHVWPELKYGTIGCKPGAMMATNYVFALKLHGQSTHCSTPHLGSELISMLANFTSYLNTISSKLTSLEQPVAINIGQISGGKQANISLAELQLTGTIRAQSDCQLSQITSLIDNYLSATCPLYKLEYQFQRTECSYPCVVNSKQLVDFHKLPQTVTNPSFAVEDFGFYKQLGPSLFSFIGTDEGEQMSLHSPRFLPNPKIIEEISSYYLKILEDWINA